jgi:hypothetical protein
MELEGREHIMNILPHHSRHSNGIAEIEQVGFEEHRNRVRTDDTTRRWGSSAIVSIHDIEDTASVTKSWEW